MLFKTHNNVMILVILEVLCVVCTHQSDMKNKEENFSLELNPHIVSNSKVDVQGNFTIKLLCNTLNESDVNCQRFQFSKINVYVTNTSYTFN